MRMGGGGLAAGGVGVTEGGRAGGCSRVPRSSHGAGGSWGLWAQLSGALGPGRGPCPDQRSLTLGRMDKWGLLGQWGKL